LILQSEPAKCCNHVAVDVRTSQIDPQRPPPAGVAVRRCSFPDNRCLASTHTDRRLRLAKQHLVMVLMARSAQRVVASVRGPRFIRRR